MQKENKMGTMPIPKLLLNMALPVMASMLVQAMYNVVDSIYISRMLFKEEALSAVSFAFPIQMLIIYVSTGTGVGVNSLVARLLGQKKYEDASLAARNSYFLTAVFGIAFFIAAQTMVLPYFNIMTDDKTIITMGCDYLSICFSFSFFVIATIIGERLLQSTGRTVLSMISQMSGAITNIVLDPIFIFGAGPIPAMGIKGAAIATVTGNAVSFLFSVFFNLAKNPELSFDFKSFRPDAAIIKEIFKVGVPSIILQSVSSILNMGINTILASFEIVAVSVFGIYCKVQSFVFMPVFGLTNSMIPIVSYNYGAGSKERIIKTIKLCSLTAFCILTFGMILFSFGGELILKVLFDATPSMLSIGTEALRIMSLSFIPAAFGIVFSSAFQGLGNGVYSLILSVARQLVFILPAAFIFGKIWDLKGVWFSYPFAEIAGFMIAVVLFIKIYKEKIAPLPDKEQKQ